MKRLLPTSPGKLWALLFAFWGLFLTGGLAGFVDSPGIIQAARLGSLLDSKHDQQEALQDELRKLQNEAVQLEKSKIAQQREIRRVLGYAAPDELIFDFSGDFVGTTVTATN